jgi:carboxypeptidase Taq
LNGIIMPATNELYDELVSSLKRTGLLGSCSNVLGWDEQTYLPLGGAGLRADQLSLLAGMIHERATSPRVGELLTELEQSGDLGDDNSAMAVNVAESRHAYDRATKLPRALVEELSRVTTLSQQAWVEARKNSDFAAFLPWLEQVVKLKREEAQAIGYGDGVPYDALLDDYEPGATTADIEAVFTPLREELVPLVAAIHDSGREPDGSIITRSYPVEAQREFGTSAAEEIGFDFTKGRLDVAAHPFCSGFGPGDCRLTTRYDEHHFPGAFFGVLHEAGHGMYEQGLDPEAFGTPMGYSTSLGIHESQSRLWENFVGRGRAFWSHFYVPAQQAFPAALGDVSVDDFHAAINDVRPSFIRVESDEVTYNLHIMLRFELEQPLVSGDLQPADVPSAWNEKFSSFFGIIPDTDANGCLQDIHWSGGGIGYFPTYALGNMYAAQFFDAAAEELGDLDEQFARGEFAPLKKWLNENIHQRGRQYRANRLVEVVTGQSLSHAPLMKHLHARFGALYGL